MTFAPRKIAQIKLIWAGLAVLLVAFLISMGALNAWQLEHRGVQVRGALLGSEVVRVVDCGRDPATLFQSFNCNVWRDLNVGPRPAELRSPTALEGAVLVDAYPSGKPRQVVLVAPGVQAAYVTWMPTDAALVIWLLVLVLVPMVVAVINGVRHSRDSRLGPVNPFDAMAKSWDDDPAKVQRAEVVAAAIRRAVPAGGDWLDFGAGTGLLGVSLLDHAESMVLADASAGMLAQASAKIDQLDLGDRVGVLELDLAEADGPADSCDVIVSLLALHHVSDVALAVQRLAAMLRPGGSIALADLDAEDGSFHSHGGVRPAHHGISRAALAGWLNAAGLVDARFETVVKLHKQGRDYDVFLAVARKPAA